jgi:hypothetical protein
MATISRESATVFVPHVLGIFALCELVVLLPGIALEVVQVFFAISIAVFYTEFQVG